jgi:hypothetical protein
MPHWWTEQVIIGELKNLGLVHKLSLKRQRKYITVRATMTLSKDYDKSFARNDFGTF